MKVHEVLVPEGFERYLALWNDPHYLSSFSLGVRVVAGSNPATPTNDKSFLFKELASPRRDGSRRPSDDCDRVAFGITPRGSHR